MRDALAIARGYVTGVRANGTTTGSALWAELLQRDRQCRNTVGNIRKDFAHSDKKQHRKRRAEGRIDAGILKPLIGDAVLDTRKAQDASGIIDCE